MRELSKEEMLSINGGRGVIACAGCRLVEVFFSWYSRYLKKFGF